MRAVAVDYDAPSLELRTECREGARLRWLLPGQRSWNIEVEPAGRIARGEMDTRLASMSCREGGELHVRVVAAE